MAKNKSLIDQTDEFMANLLARAGGLTDINEQADIGKVLISWIQVKNKIQPDAKEESKIDEWSNAIKNGGSGGRNRGRRVRAKPSTSPEAPTDKESQEAENAGSGTEPTGFRNAQGSSGLVKPPNGAFHGLGGGMDFGASHSAKS